MAGVKHVGQYYVLSYEDVSSPVHWKVVACLNQKQFKSAQSVIDATTDCGPDQLAGTVTQSMSISGLEQYGDTAIITGGNLYDLQIAPQNQQSPAYMFKLEPATPVTGDETYTFPAFISNYQKNYNTNQPIDFSCDLTIQGIAVRTVH